MGNDTRHYFGAYLEIKLRQREVNQLGHYCTKKNRPEEDSWSRDRRNGSFCRLCGKPTGSDSIKVMEYPRWLSDLIGEEFEDVLTTLKVPELDSTETMLVKGNQSDNTRWLSLDCDGWGGLHTYPFPQFPDANAIYAMRHRLVAVYADAIAALKASPLVESVEVKAGYVLDQDY